MGHLEILVYLVFLYDTKNHFLTITKPSVVIYRDIMTSRAFESGNFLEPDSNPTYPSKDEVAQRYRKHNVYDAVAGKSSNRIIVGQHI